MDLQADDQQKAAKDIESETQIVDSPDALVLSSDPNHVRPRLHIIHMHMRRQRCNKQNSQQISFLSSVKLSTS